MTQSTQQTFRKLLIGEVRDQPFRCRQLVAEPGRPGAWHSAASPAALRRWRPPAASRREMGEQFAAAPTAFIAGSPGSSPRASERRGLVERAGRHHARGSGDRRRHRARRAAASGRMIAKRYGSRLERAPPAMPPSERAGGAHHPKARISRCRSLGRQPRRHHRVERRQRSLKRLAARCRVQLGGLGASISAGTAATGASPSQQRPQIQPGAADQDRQAAGAMGGIDLGQASAAPAPGRAALGGVEHAIEPVRHARLAACVGPRRQDAQLAIDLQAVGIDDRAAERARQCRAPAPTCRSRSARRRRPAAAPPRAACWPRRRRP